MRKIGIITAGRSDFGIYRPVLQRLSACPNLEPLLFATGGHFSTMHGKTISEIKAEGFPIAAEIAVFPETDDLQGIANAMGRITQAFSKLFAEIRPDLLMILGDRFDMFAAASAAVPYSLPMAHLHGGEITEGAIDNVFRHALTKISHLHFAATETAAARIRQMGEEPWRVVTTGAPALDQLGHITYLSQQELERTLDITLVTPPLLVTYHPVTLGTQDTHTQIHALLNALEDMNRPLIFTFPNTDMMSSVIIKEMQSFCEAAPNRRLVENLGTANYFSLMRSAAAMAGNSSSGIIEAASFKLPVVDIGPRQQGREHARNVLHAPCETAAIRNSLETACSETFRQSLQNLVNPYGDGHAAERIIQTLQEVPIDKKLLMKKFYELKKDPKHE